MLAYLIPRGSSSWLTDSHFLTVSSHDSKKGKALVSFLLVRALISSWGYTLMTSSKTNYFPKALPPNSITQGGGAGGREGVRASTYEFVGHQSITSIDPTRSFKHSWFA